jgi:hypothetical protein
LGGRSSDGSIADVAFFNTDLSSTQISAIYSSAFVPIPEPSTVALLGAGVATLAALGLVRRFRPA